MARDSIMIGKRNVQHNAEDAEREAAIALEKKEDAEATEVAPRRVALRSACCVSIMLLRAPLTV